MKRKKNETECQSEFSVLIFISFQMIQKQIAQSEALFRLTIMNLFILMWTWIFLKIHSKYEIQWSSGYRQMLSNIVICFIKHIL